MNMCQPSSTPTTDFTDAWREFLFRHQTRFQLLFSLVRLTGAGVRRVPIERVAVDLSRSASETQRLLADLTSKDRPWFRVTLDADTAAFHFTGNFTGNEARPRFRYLFDHRSIGVGGCAPDGFVLAYGLREPFSVEALCPVTGATIRVDFAEDGAVAADPAGAVVAVIHPDTAADALTFNDMGRVDADLCLQQPFFASAQTAAGWLSTHPGGKALPVLDFDQMWRRLLDETQPTRAAR